MSHGATSLVWHHSKATGTDLLVAMAIANYISDSGAWPKVETIAADARTSVRTVHRSLQTLKDLGEITWTKGDGTGSGVYKTSRYFITLTCPENCSGDWNHNERRDAQSRPDKMSPLEDECQNVTSRPDKLSPLDMTQVADKPVIEPVIEPVNLTNVHQDALFDEFWIVYPRKQNKIQAKKLYQTALTKCEHETLIATARRYAKDPNRLDAYTKMASTWLANECWNDAPLPERIGATPAVDLEALRAKTAREKQATKELIASMAREGTPPPQCEHGNSIARCPRCLAK